jgi:hypothetical protein
MDKNINIRNSLVYFIVFVFALLVGCSEQSEINVVPSLNAITRTVEAISPTVDVNTNANTTLTPSEEINNEAIQPSPLEILTQNGVTVTLYWTYADHFRIAMAYEVSNVEVPEGFTLYCPVLSMTLNGNPGNLQYSYVDGYGNADDMFTNCSIQADGSFFVTHNFYLPELADHMEFNVTADIAVGGLPLINENGERANMPDYGVFHFQYTIQNNGGLTIANPEKVTKDGVAITMNRVEINPSFLSAYICLDYENFKEWYLEASLNFRGYKVNSNPVLTFRTDIKDIDLSNWFNQFTPHRCFRLVFPINKFQVLSNLPLEAIVTVEKITVNALPAATQDDCDDVREKVQQVYPDLNFVCEFGNRDESYHELLVKVTKKPAGMDTIEAQQIVEEGFLSVIEGPWSFPILAP